MYCEECGLETNNAMCYNCGIKKDPLEKKKKNAKRILIASIILSLVAIGVVYIGFKLASSPKSIMLQSISRFATNTSNMVKGVNDSEAMKRLRENDKIGILSNVVLTVNEDLGLGIEDLELNMSYVEHTKDKSSVFNMELKTLEETINLNTVLKDNKAYIMFQEVTDFYYYIDFDFISLFENTEEIEYDKLISIIKKNVINTIDSKDIKKSSEKITLGETRRKVTKLSYDVSNQNLIKLAKGLLEDIKKDKKLVRSIAANAGIKEADLNKSINDALKEIKKFETESKAKLNDIVFTYNVYYYGFNNIVKEELVIDSISFSYISYGKTKEIILTSDEEVLASYKTVETKTGYDYTINIIGFDLTGTYNKTTKTLTLKFELFEDGYIEVIAKTNLTSNKNSYVEKVNLTFNVKMGDEEIKNAIKLDITTTIDFTNTLIEVPENIKDAALIDEDLEEIMERIADSPILMMIFNLLLGSELEEIEEI